MPSRGCGCTKVAHSLALPAFGERKASAVSVAIGLGETLDRACDVDAKMRRCVRSRTGALGRRSAEDMRQSLARRNLPPDFNTGPRLP